MMALSLKGLGKKADATADAAEAALRPPQVVVPEARARPARPPARNRNRGWMLAGGLLILIAGIAAASIASSLSQSVDVLVASRPIAEGAVISADDYRSVSIAADTGAIQAIAPSDGENLIGQIASGPIGEGSILHPDQFTNRADQEIEGTIVIGAALGPNNLPVLDLLPGDRVRLFQTFGEQLSTSGAFGGGDTEQVTSVAREITDAEVVSTESLSGIGNRHVALRISSSNANIVANLIESGRLSIVLVDSLPSTSAVEPVPPQDPLAPAEPGDG